MTKRALRSLVVVLLIAIAVPVVLRARTGRFPPERILVAVPEWQFNTYLNRANDFHRWTAGEQIPWFINDEKGPAHPAVGDVGDFTLSYQNGVGADEVIFGLSKGGAGWLAIMMAGFRDGHYTLDKWIQVPWAAYNERNGETFPAVGNLDGDAFEEIVVGLGETGGGWFAIFDDSTTNYRFLGWHQLQWPAYNARNGALHPAIGDIDGDGTNEIVLGLETGGGGWLAVLNGAPSGFSHRRWLRVDWSAYNERNGLTYPAMGDIDGDGRAEIVVGLGPTSGGWVQVIDDAAAGFVTSWIRSSRVGYNARNGEMHPAVGNVDGDANDEIVLGQGNDPYQSVFVEIIDDSRAGYASLALREVYVPYTYPSYTVTTTYPAVGVLADPSGLR